MRPKKIADILQIIASFVGSTPDDLAVTRASKIGPYAILVSTILSTRTKDEVTQVATPQLLALAPTPKQMVLLPDETIARAIYPTSFHNMKAKMLKRVSQQLIDRHGGEVPDNLEELLLLYGLGRKCANLVLTLGFGKPGICVDTHVFSISNRMGFVKARTPHEAEEQLRDKLPAKWWIPINGVLIAFGRSICTPVSPKCSQCPVRSQCPRIGVTKSR
jgi:endonuclease-3